jgi:glycerol-3-phosphate acyltransferase PlsY
MVWLVLSVVAIGYLLGSIPSAYIVGRLLGGVDIREVGDGRMGAAAAFHRLGFWGGAIVGVMDFGKGVAAVMLAQRLDVPLVVVLLAGLAAVVGHDWSIFLHFTGGRGAATTYGVLASLVFWQFLIALGIAAIPYFSTHKSGLATGIMFGTLPLVLWTYGASALLIIFPIFLSTPMLLKHFSTARVAITDDGKHA